jgi:hypothetical protein
MSRPRFEPSTYRNLVELYRYASFSMALLHGLQYNVYEDRPSNDSALVGSCLAACRAYEQYTAIENMGAVWCIQSIKRCFASTTRGIAFETPLCTHSWQINFSDTINTHTEQHYLENE